MLDLSKLVQKNVKPGTIQPRRAPVYLGFNCHQGCGFCYYKLRCGEKPFELDFVEKQIRFLASYGIREFEFTGGEPGEHPAFVEAVQIARSIVPDAKIAAITNGSLGLRRGCVEAVDEILLSYHLGRRSQAYSREAFPRGCTWEKASATAARAKRSGKFLRTNTVLGAFNLDCLDSILDDVEELGPAIANFLPVNLFDQATGMASQIDYIRLGPILARAIERLEVSLPETLVVVRYVPFCQLPGYADHVAGHLQHVWDWFDWNVELDGVAFMDWLAQPEKALAKLGPYGSTSVQAAFKTREALYEKPASCLRCKWLAMCDGFEKFPGSRLLDLAKPQLGRMQLDPVGWIGKETEKRHKQIYG